MGHCLIGGRRQKPFKPFPHVFLLQRPLVDRPKNILRCDIDACSIVSKQQRTEGARGCVCVCMWVCMCACVCVLVCVCAQRRCHDGPPRRPVKLGCHACQ
jgi:hypothetical protein